MLNFKRIIFLCFAAGMLTFCGSSEVREELPIHVPEEIDAGEAGKNVAEAQKELEKLKN